MGVLHTPFISLLNSILQGAHAIRPYTFFNYSGFFFTTN
jgi:hypothetical protein